MNLRGAWLHVPQLKALSIGLVASVAASWARYVLLRGPLLSLVRVGCYRELLAFVMHALLPLVPLLVVNLRLELGL